MIKRKQDSVGWSKQLAVFLAAAAVRHPVEVVARCLAPLTRGGPNLPTLEERIQWDPFCLALISALDDEFNPEVDRERGEEAAAEAETAAEARAAAVAGKGDPDAEAGKG